MPRLRVFRSPFFCAVALLGCRSPSSDGSPPPSGSAPAPASASAAPSAAAETDDFTPVAPGYVNQRDPKGGFVSARTAPPPERSAPEKLIVFDTPPEEVKTPEPKAENGHCGEIDLGGGDKVVLDCMTDDYGVVAGAAKPAITGDEAGTFRSHRKLPSVVDHRKDGTEGPVLSQGKSGTCTAFSLVGAVDHAVAHSLGHAPSLSPMHAWARYHQPKMNLAENDNLGKGLTDLANFAFDAKLANEWQHGHRVDSALLRRADEKSLVEITNITRIEPTNMGEIRSVLASGQDVWFSIKGAHGLQHPKKNADGESVVGDFDYRKSGSRGGHAILLSGYEETPKGTFYLIHNSWGPKWGTEGYAWIWEKTLRNNINEAYVVQAQPTDLAHAHHPPANHRFSSCRSGLAPDAITTQCVPTCGDGGPRVNGVCPTAGQCPDGEVNLVGKCELSAPALAKTLSNGIRVTCGLSGCTYVVPNGQESCSSEKGCTISCAAPRFMLGSGPRGLACNG